MMEFTTTIEFKSPPEFFEKESSGIKPNTTRIVSIEEDAKIQTNIKNIKYIRISNTDTLACSSVFVRELSDISKFKSCGLIIYVFSWHR